MEKMQRMVEQFMKVARQEIADYPAVPSDEVRDLRIRLMKEELLGSTQVGVDTDNPQGLIKDKSDELIQSMLDGNLKGVADGIADLLYVVLGTASVYGIDAEVVLKAVHESNMSKFHRTTDGLYYAEVDEGGKVIAAPTYEPPKIDRALLLMAARSGRGRGDHPFVEKVATEMQWVDLPHQIKRSQALLEETLRVWTAGPHYTNIETIAEYALAFFNGSTPFALTDHPSEWSVSTGRGGRYVNNRNPLAYSEDGGKTYYIEEEYDLSANFPPNEPTFVRKYYTSVAVGKGLR